MGEPGMLERVKVREVAGVFGTQAAATPAVDELLLAGFDRVDIDVVAEGDRLRQQTGGAFTPAVRLADMPNAPRREFVAPEDTASVFVLCAAVMACLGTIIGVLIRIAFGGTTAARVIAAVFGGIVGCGLGILIA